MKDFENLTTEEQTNVIMEIGSKLTGQEIWYWEGIVYLLREQDKEIKKLKDETEKLTKEWLKSQEKRRKAIEYLEQPFRDNFDFSKATLLEILDKEGDKE